VEIGRLICDALVPEDDDARAPGGEVVVETQLIVRESTARPPVAARSVRRSTA